jgi:hypothetical protein
MTGKALNQAVRSVLNQAVRSVLRARWGDLKYILYVSEYRPHGYDVRHLVGADDDAWESFEYDNEDDLQLLSRAMASGSVCGDEVLHISLKWGGPGNQHGEIVDDLLFDLESMSVV